MRRAYHGGMGHDMRRAAIRDTCRVYGPDSGAATAQHCQAAQQEQDQRRRLGAQIVSMTISSTLMAPVISTRSWAGLGSRWMLYVDWNQSLASGTWLTSTAGVFVSVSLTAGHTFGAC